MTQWIWERTRLACWFRRLAETILFRCTNFRFRQRSGKVHDRETRSSARGTRALPEEQKTKHNGQFRITSFLQLESRTCLSPAAAESASPSSHSSFCEEVFSRSEPDWHSPEVRVCSTDANSDFLAESSVTLANEVERSNILAPGLWSRFRGTLLLPAFTPECFRGLALGSRIQLQQRNCSRFARDFSRRSTLLFQARKELARELLPCPWPLKTNLPSRAIIAVVPASNSSPNILVTGGAGFIGSNL